MCLSRCTKRGLINWERTSKLPKGRQQQIVFMGSLLYLSPHLASSHSLSPLSPVSSILDSLFCILHLTTTMVQFYILLDLVGFDFWIIEGWVCAGSVAFWGGSFSLAGLEDWVVLVFSEWRIKWRYWKASFELVFFFLISTSTDLQYAAVKLSFCYHWSTLDHVILF